MDVDNRGETFSLAHEAAAKRFTLSREGRVIGEAAYVDVPVEGRQQRVFTHTEVSPAFGNRGLAAELVGFALRTTAEADLPYRSMCSYVTRFIADHPEFSAAQP